MQTEANEFGVQPDLSTSFDAIPCMPEDFDLEQVHHHLIYHMLYLYIKLFYRNMELPVGLLVGVNHVQTASHQTHLNQLASTCSVISIV